MSIAVLDEHVALADSVRGWASRHAPVELARAALDGGDDLVPGVWSSLGTQGLLGLHVPEALGGAGYGDLELAVVAEQLGHAMVPGPVLPTLHASRLLVEVAAEATAGKLVPELASGAAVGAVAFEPGLVATATGSGVHLSGTLRPVPGAQHADVLVVGGRDERGHEHWVAVDRGDVSTTPLASLDATRRLAAVVVDGDIPAERVLPGLTAARVQQVAVLLYAAEAAGIAAWACDEASAYAKVREQFGRPIGQFQAVKHLCADQLVRVEQARAVAWDLAVVEDAVDQRALATAVAAAIALEAAVTCTMDTIQILGGTGFTWEHDAHVYLKRALAVRQLLGGPGAWRGNVARAAIGGLRRELALALDDDAATAEIRADVRAVLADLPEAEPDRRAALVDAGLISPHWPSPYGRDATPREQVAIDEELARAGVRPPDLVIAGWILPTIVRYGTDAQRERFVRPTMLGEITWCQLYSEPGAGSDLAALSTRAERVEGGWRLTGQKVWTSLAHTSDWGLALARTDPDAPKHEGITAFLVDMRSVGVDVRPLREITGRALFNEVFLDDVFVPDELVCGGVGRGWRTARTTLANERVAMSAGSAMGAGVEDFLAALAGDHRTDDPLLLDRVGELVCEGQALGLLGFRTTLRQLEGSDPGASASVRKLVGGRHAQRCAELRLELLGPEGATTEGAARAATHQLLNSQCLTIAGGTTAVQRNVVAERLLGLPRDP